MKISYKRGFTLIELLVVIAIIGILSSVVLASLNSARVKGRIASAQGTMKGIQTAAAMCVNDALAIAIPTATNDGGGAALCASSPTAYSALPTGWVYSAASTQTTGTSFSLIATGDSKTITCTETTCTTS